MIDIKKLVEAGVHFGHKTSRWHPKMAPFIWGFKDGVHLINVAKTASQLEKASQFLESVAAEGKAILWVGTKKVAQPVIESVGKSLGLPYVIHRWIGGTLTNYSQVKKSVTKLLHYEDIINKSDQFSYTKKELVNFQKIADRLTKNVGSIKNFAMPVGAVVVVDVRKEQTVLREAAAMGVPVVGLVDTNSDPCVNYVIPCNDDATSSLKLILEYLGDAVKRGHEKRATKKGSQAEQVHDVAPGDMVDTELIVKNFVVQEDVGEDAEGKKAISKKKDALKVKDDLQKPSKDWRHDNKSKAPRAKLKKD